MPAPEPTTPEPTTPLTPLMPLTLLISDLHLSETRPDSTRAFVEFMAGRARLAGSLYILGDLFDYWLGDDDLDNPFVATIVNALAAASDTGLSISLMHGNRDFLLGKDFAHATGVRLLPDPTLIELNGVRTLLMHGDTLCVEDTAYNAFRATVRQPAWQQAFLARPMAERRAEAKRLRVISERAKQTKAAEIMDVTPSEVLRMLRAHGYPRLIHGHTHRPMRHLHAVDGRSCERWVLSDWHTQATGLAVEASGTAFQFTFPTPSAAD